MPPGEPDDRHILWLFQANLVQKSILFFFFPGERTAVPHTCGIKWFCWSELFSEETHIFSVVLVVKNLPANARDVRDVGSIPGSRKSCGEGNGNPVQYSCLENPMDRGAWWDTVHGVAKTEAT